MATNNLSSTSLAIEDLVTSLGTVSIGQIFKLLPNMKKETVQFYIMALVKKQKINIVQDAYLVPFMKKDADINMVQAIWVMLNKNEEKTLFDEEIELCFSGEKPVDLCFMKDDTLLEVLTINKYTINNINYIAEKDKARTVKGDAADDFIKYVFIIDNPDMLERLGEYGIAFPHEIAYVRDNGTDSMPQITYYSVEKQ